MKFEIEGNGFVLSGGSKSTIGSNAEIKLAMSIDGKTPEKIIMPTAFKIRKHELAWKYQPRKKT